MKKLNAWEQLFVQRMHVNYDRYPTKEDKIIYTKSHLTISKKANNLINRYWKDKLSTITTFQEQKEKLCKNGRNRFEEKNTRTYLQDILKQGNMSFEKYFYLFLKKKTSSIWKKLFSLTQ